MNSSLKVFLVVMVVVAGTVGIVKWGGPLMKKSGGTAVDESKPHEFYTCSMHPEVHMHDPGQCPICGMTLIKISPESASAGTGDSAGTVTLAPEKLQRIGVTFGRVERVTLNRIIRAYGRVAYDPDLYQVQEEYLSAVELAELSRDVSHPSSRERSTRLLKASETRLRLLGLNDAQIRILRERRRVDPELLLGSQESGKVWVYADVYESDLSAVETGFSVEIEANAYPGRTFQGKILSIDPVLNPRSRTAKIRSEIADTAGVLKPDMYVNVKILSNIGEVLAVPEGAVLNSGNEQHLFVHRGGGKMEPRKIRTGRKTEGQIEILEGVAEGEEIVTSGNFLIDSESRLRAGISGMSFYKGQEAAGGEKR